MADQSTFPGMTLARVWTRSPVHQHTYSYSCAYCGRTLGSPHKVYVHIDSQTCRRRKKRNK